MAASAKTWRTLGQRLKMVIRTAGAGVLFFSWLRWQSVKAPRTLEHIISRQRH
jgi:hypothetical protein